MVFDFASETSCTRTRQIQKEYVNAELLTTP